MSGKDFKREGHPPMNYETFEPTGFPSPAQDSRMYPIDLNLELVTHPSTTFFARIDGESMSADGVHDGDILVIDRSLSPRSGDMVVCYIDGAFNVKYFRETELYGVMLYSIDPDRKPLRLSPSDDFTIWGVVTYVIHKANKRRL